MKSLREEGSIRVITVAGAVVAGFFVGGGCATEKVLADRPFIPAPSDQIADAGFIPALPPFVNVAPIPDIPPFPEFEAEPITYTVKKKDSFWKIARMHGVSMQELAAFNNMDSEKPLKVDTTLKIPPGGALIPEDKLPPLPKKTKVAPALAPREKRPEALPSDGTYTVKDGDSIWKIARRFDTTVDRIVSANNINPKTPLQVGQKLRISGALAGVATEPAVKTAVEREDIFAKPDVKTTAPDPALPTKGLIGPETDDISDLLTEEDLKAIQDALPGGAAFDEMSGFSHSVEEGDTWASIAKFYGNTVEDMKKANPSASALGEPKPGTSIIIPPRR